MNYSSHFKYYSPEIRKQNEYVVNTILYSHLTQYIQEKHDFFKTHKYILNMLTEREGEFLSLYLGLDNDNCLQQNKIAELYGLSRERVRQILFTSFTKLCHPASIILLTNFDDKDIKIRNFQAEDFYKNRFQITCKKLLRQVQKERLDIIDKDERYADLLLGKIMTSTPFQMHLLGQGVKGLPSEVTTVEDLLALSAQDLIKIDDKGLTDKIRALGLHFFSEFDYEEHWVRNCRQGLMQVGLNGIKKHLNIDLRSSDFEKLLDSPIKVLKLSNRAYNCASRMGIKTIGQMIVLTESDYAQITNLGENTIENIHQCLNKFGLDMCPDYMTNDEWLKTLSKKDYSKFEMIAFYNKNVSRKDNFEMIELDNRNSSIKQNEQTNDERIYACKLEKVLEMPIENLTLTQRSYNCLKRLKINTIKDLISTSTMELIKTKNFGKACLEDVLEALKPLDLSLRPDNVNAETWLLSLFKSVNEQEAPSDGKNQNFDIEEYKKSTKFNQLMQKSIKEMKLSMDTFNLLQSNGFITIRDIVNQTEFELWCKLDNADKNSFVLQEIEDKVNELGLSFKPAGYKGNWIKTLQEQYIYERDSMQRDKSKQEIDFQRLVAKMILKYELIGVKPSISSCNKDYVNRAISLIKDEINESNHERLFNLAIRNTASNPEFRIKYTKLKVDDKGLTSEHILNSVRANIESILQLDERFILINSDYLINMVNKNNELNILQKLELINFICNIKSHGNIL